MLRPYGLGFRVHGLVDLQVKDHVVGFVLDTFELLLLVLEYLLNQVGFLLDGEMLRHCFRRILVLASPFQVGLLRYVLVFRI